NGGCCSAGTCVTGTAGAACGTNGGACTNCAGQASNKACVAGVCGCNAATDCQALNACSIPLHSCEQLCGGNNTGCNGGGCRNMATGGQCVQGTVANQCGNTGGQCQNCQSACGPGPHCVNLACACVTSLDCMLTSSCGSRTSCSGGG